MKIWFCAFQLVIKGELRHKQDLIVIFNKVSFPWLALLVRPESKVENLFRQVLHIEDIVSVSYAAEDHDPSVYLGDKLLIYCDLTFEYSLNDYFHVLYYLSV